MQHGAAANREVHIIKQIIHQKSRFPPVNLNARAAALCRSLAHDAARLRVEVHQLQCGATVVDCGVTAPGGLEAGLLVARVCLADLGRVALLPADGGLSPAVQVYSDQPVLACMASQYAGWEVKGERFFAMGSGPMRAAAAREPLFDDLAYSEQATQCVGVLEAGKLPPDAVCRDIAEKCRIEPRDLTLLVAPTRSLAGTLQVTARSVETALHKLHELKFDLRRIESAWGAAPLPPPADNDLAAIGRTNDAILYGGCATLYVRGDDQSLEAVGPHAPSSASKDYGRPFAEVLAAANHDFYQVDPLLFSPAAITFVNLDTGNAFVFGRINRPVLVKSFGMTDR
ncbi:MAG: methenyltetrahydromethanopterin cyclohydrolase [Planctomycetota bacterium]|nr:MAG: methenyltetrahydromethanopterin cyclohydrolase [Planctomycetota bacterium]